MEKYLVILAALWDTSLVLRTNSYFCERGIWMKQLKSGQHFGAAKSRIQLDGTILTEAGYTAGIEVPWHYHENAYFFMHLRGHLEEVNKKKRINCIPGTLLFHHWQDPHYDTKFTRDARFFHIEIANRWFDKFGISQSIGEGSFFLENPLLKSIFRKIYNELSLHDNATQLSVDGLLAQAFSILSRQSGHEKKGLPAWVGKIKEILHDVEAENISLELLAKETSLHPVYLSNGFAKYFGINLGEYTRRLKLEKATGLLLNKKISITDIAYECGYADQSHFIREFKKANGITPLRFRKQIES